MTAESWNLAISVVGIIVTVWLTWASTRGIRASRRGEEAKLALDMLAQLRSMAVGLGDPRDPDGDQARQKQLALANRVEDAAHFASSEFARLTLRDGWSWTLILTLVVYGVWLTVLGAITWAPASTTLGPLIPLLLGVGLLTAALGCAKPAWIRSPLSASSALPARICDA